MAKSTSLFLPKNANNQSITLTSADTSVAKLCFTAGADDSNVKAILATTNDTATINLAIYLTRGAVDYLIGTVNVPVASGTNGSAGTVDLLSASAFPGLPLEKKWNFLLRRPKLRSCRDVDQSLDGRSNASYPKLERWHIGQPARESYSRRRHQDGQRRELVDRNGPGRRPKCDHHEIFDATPGQQPRDQELEVPGLE
jgi:hypothetical protein